MQIDVQIMDPAMWYTRLNSGDFQLTLSVLNNLHRHPIWLLANPPFRLIENPFWPDGLPQAYVDAANTANTTLDDAQQRTAFGRIQQIVQDESCVVPIAWRYTLLAYQTYVRNLSRTMDGWIVLDDAEKA